MEEGEEGKGEGGGLHEIGPQMDETCLLCAFCFSWRGKRWERGSLDLDGDEWLGKNHL